MRSFLGYYWRMISHVWKAGKRWARDQILAAVLIALVIVFIQIRLGVVRPSDIRGTQLSVIYPYCALLLFFIAVHLLRAPWKLDQERQADIKRLQDEQDRLRAENGAACQTVLDLRRRLEDDGPAVILDYEKSPLYTGFKIKSDQDICEVVIRGVESSNYVLRADRLHHVRANEPAAVIFHSVRKGEGGSEALEEFGGFESAFEDYCGENFKAEIPLEIEHWDLRSNQFRVRYLVLWDKIRVRMGLSPAIRREPRSYSWVEPEAVRAIETPAVTRLEPGTR